jgi:hypothetical protein
MLTIRSYNLDFNWETNPHDRAINAFAAPGAWADADPVRHVAWYKTLGVNVIQTFCVSCNGYAWYESGVVPEQPGLEHDFLREMVRLGHRENMLVLGYFCPGANTKWGLDHPELSYGTPTEPHIPYTDEYLAYLEASIVDAVGTTGIDGFMVDWLRMPLTRASHGGRWLECEKRLYAQLMSAAFPGEDRLDAAQAVEFGRRAVDRCWETIRRAAKRANPDCIVWLTCCDVNDPHIVNSRALRETDWLLNEAGDLKGTADAKRMIGPHTRLITCLAEWNGQDPAEIVPAAIRANVGLYGFAAPGPDSLRPLEPVLARSVDNLRGDDRNLAILARVYHGVSMKALWSPEGRFVEPAQANPALKREVLRLALNEPPPHHQPYPFWFWNGKMEAEEIRRQLALMREAGITEFILHGRTGLQTPFLSEEWFAAVGTAVEDAATHGMRVWLYDEYNWPSGTANGAITADPCHREHFLTASGELKPVDGSYLPADRCVDYLNADRTREFIARCYQAYFDRFGQHFGRTIAGFFNDEVRFATPYPWSPSLGETPPAPADHYRRLGELIVQNHFGLLREWCEAHGVKFIGHVMGEETLGSQTRYVGDAWSVIACYHETGVDHLGPAATGHHPILPASVAALSGIREVTAETFAGNPWEMTPHDLYRISGWLYANGVTRMILHGFFYTRDGEAANDWPPDLFFRWSGWSGMADSIRWAGRVQHFLARATPRRRVALYYPLEEFQREFVPHPDYTLGYVDAAPVGNDRARAMHLNLGELMNAMIRRGIDFDLAPCQWLDRVRDRVLVVPTGARVAGVANAVPQGDRAPEACIAEVDRRLGPRVRVEGPHVEPRPRPVSPRLSDPYVHEGDDDGGVWVREFEFDGRPAVLLWNANATAFEGRCDLVETGPWSVWNPADGTLEPRGETDRLEMSLAPHSLLVVLGE